MSLKKIIYKNHFPFMVFFIICLLIEAYINHYHYLFSHIIPTSSFYNDLEKYSHSNKIMGNIKNFIWYENGIIENIQIFFLILSVIFFSIFIKNNKVINFRFSKYLFILYLVALIYYFLEEVSWGQHFFGWNSPEIFNELNKQNETNLHNISEIFNQFPRILLILWCCLTFLIIKLDYFKNNNSFKIFIFPSNKLKKISLLIIVFTFPAIFFENYFDYASITEDTFNQAFFRWNGEIITNNGFLKFKILLIDFANLKFIRLSELQELLFNYYIILHILYLKKYSSLINNIIDVKQ